MGETFGYMPFVLHSYSHNYVRSKSNNKDNDNIKDNKKRKILALNLSLLCAIVV